MNNDIIIESLQSYKEYIEKLPEGCQLIADYLRENSINEAMKIIAQFSEGMNWIIDMNKLLCLHIQIPQIDEKGILEYLSEINAGLEIQDFVVVSDMFEYEIKPFFEEHNQHVQIEQ